LNKEEKGIFPGRKGVMLTGDGRDKVVNKNPAEKGQIGNKKVQYERGWA